MKLTLFQIDAFTERVFNGNPAAVCPLQQWLPDSTLQKIAAENNLSETAFYVPIKNGFHIRWFTPLTEVDLCGHATLATAFVIFNLTSYPDQFITFNSKSGELFVKKEKDVLSLDFPAQPGTPCETPQELIAGLGQTPIAVLKSEDYIAVFDSERDIAEMEPDFDYLAKLDGRGVSVTAPGSNVDFVSRFFCPKLGVNEDPVTGSAHCALTPYWAEKLDKAILSARQLSKRTGDLTCEVKGDRVIISGKAVKYLEGSIDITL